MSDTECALEMGRAQPGRAPATPSGGPDGRGELIAAGRTWRFQHVQVGNPQCAIRMWDEAELDALDLGSIGPSIEHHELFPEPDQRVVASRSADPAGFAPGSSSAGWGRPSASGTGATGAAVAYVLDGGRSPVTVVLDGGELAVEVGDDLQIKLTGWAVPVFRGTLTETFLEELHATK